MEDNLNDCLCELFNVLQGELVVGNHDSLTIFGSAEQQNLGETAKEIARLFLKQGYDIEITINHILDELRNFDVVPVKKSWNPLSKRKSLPHSVLIGHFNATYKYIEKLKVELTLQEAQLLKEDALLKHFEEKMQRNDSDLQNCITQGTRTLQSLDQKSLDEFTDQEEVIQWKGRLTQKIQDLSVSKAVSSQSLLQLKLLIENNDKLIERISVLTSKTLPIWQEQMTALISVANFAFADSQTEFLDELELLKTMESLDKKIRKVLNNFASEGSRNCE